MKKVSPKKLLLLIFLGLILVGCDQMPFGSSGGRYPASSMPPSAACYALESGVTLTVDPDYLSADCESQLGGKTYARIRQELKIVESKIREGQPYSPDCQSGVSRLRKVADLPGNKEIYWEDESYEGNNLSDFIFLFKRIEEGYYCFDVYIDQSVEIPDFVKNCQETGGLIPVLEGFTLPPQIFGLEEQGDDIPGDFDTDCSSYTCLLVGDRDPTATGYFEAKKAEFKPYYVQVADNGSFPTGVGPSGIGLIGTLTATGTDEEKTYNVYYHADTMYLRELGEDGNETGQIYVYSPTDGPPPKPAGRHPTLQLKALKFISTAEWTWATPECKPVIYLYPEEETRLSLELDPDGYLTETEPLYEDGWRDVVAHPDGRLVYQGESFDSLHYEAMINKFRTPQEGWVVRREDLPEFFEGILPRLGLKDKEVKDFEDYWLGRLTTSPYFFAGLLSAEEIERIEPVEFSTEPKTFIRVRFYFRDLNEPLVVNPPVLSSPPVRTGFTAVEWGGLYQPPD